MKIEEYLSTLPSNILSGEEIQIPPDSIREIFRFAELGESDVFYHLGCGEGASLSIARQEFNVKSAVGIDNSKKMIDNAKKRLENDKISDVKVIEQDILEADLNDASVILCWFMDPDVMENMMKRFEKLRDGVKVITIWACLLYTSPSPRDS